MPSFLGSRFSWNSVFDYCFTNFVGEHDARHPRYLVPLALARHPAVEKELTSIAFRNMSATLKNCWKPCKRVIFKKIANSMTVPLTPIRNLFNKNHVQLHLVVVLYLMLVVQKLQQPVHQDEVWDLLPWFWLPTSRQVLPLSQLPCRWFHKFYTISALSSVSMLFLFLYVSH